MTSSAMTDRLAYILPIVYVVGLLVAPGYWANGPCESERSTDTFICTLLATVTWPASLPINISVRAFR